MKPSYTIENQSLHYLHNCILVSNYEYINKIINLPVMNDSCLVTEFRNHSNNVGLWKIKKNE
jgi:hypothetical protein